MFRVVLLLFPIILMGSPSYAQTDSSAFTKVLEDFNIRASVGFQLWGTYTHGMRVLDEDSGELLPVDNRFTPQLRRSRLSISGQPYQTLSFKLTAALDLVGHDLLAATEGGTNNGSSPGFRLWNAIVRWQIRPEDDRLNLLAGYMAAPIGRESTTAALRSNSFEKAWSQNYLRRHLVGTGPGRATGVMLAGQFTGKQHPLHLTYEAAVLNPVFQSLSGNSTGAAYSPLLVGRMAVHFGDPESAGYASGHRVNYFGKRHGLTLGVAAARQGKSDLFRENTAYGIEWLYNTHGFHLDGEYFQLHRTGLTGTSTHSATGYVRAGKNLPVFRGYVLEPVVSYWYFRGPEEAEDVAAANALRSFAGGDGGLDIGANLYFNPNTKLSLFYAHRHGSMGAVGPQDINNNFYFQSGVGTIARGSYVGAGWVIIL
ncbi:porin [Lewinella sp. W8]|uniref:porin n=1 Tax=Lewinella sp. W8 TaxID=2528208 RepID=UPI0010677262|nr:porin [Lewinella sp. W8]MTB50338.1 hypothetical protein [Lewinella sp. W8]